MRQALGVLLPGATFQTQAEHGQWANLRKQRSEFREAQEAAACRQEYKTDRRYTEKEG